MNGELRMTNGIHGRKSADRCRTILSPHSIFETQHSTFPQDGSMALLLANGSMSSNSSGEGDIRRALIEADLVECMVALPGQLFCSPKLLENEFRSAQFHSAN